MKRQRIIVFRIFFLLTVLISFGINTYTHSNIHRNSIELSLVTNDAENNTGLDMDPFDEDQINSSFERSLFNEPNCQIPVTPHHFPILKNSFSIWQPPKIS
jgi:hypothetical protein